MYDISEIKQIHLETTSLCQSRCPQCGRYDFDDDGKLIINSKITDRNGKSGLDQIYFSDFYKWFKPKFISQLDMLYMCGNFGEPILARDCLKIFAYLRTFNRRMKLSLHTNGGYRPKEWWEKLAKLGVEATFGIDGLEDTHSLYRVKVPWKRVIENAQSFIDAGGKAKWQMLVFKHNEHQIQDCKRMSEEMGFHSFVYEHTTRFGENGVPKWPVRNPKGEITHYLEPSSASSESYSEIHDGWEESTKIKETIECSARRDSELYISANGTVLPCCHIDSCISMFEFDDIADYKKKIDMYPSLHKQTLEEIFKSLYFRKIEGTWSKEPLSVCSKMCGKKTGTWIDNMSSQAQYTEF